MGWVGGPFTGELTIEKQQSLCSSSTAAFQYFFYKYLRVFLRFSITEGGYYVPVIAWEELVRRPQTMVSVTPEVRAIVPSCDDLKFSQLRRTTHEVAPFSMLVYFVYSSKRVGIIRVTSIW